MYHLRERNKWKFTTINGATRKKTSKTHTHTRENIPMDSPKKPTNKPKQQLYMKHSIVCRAFFCAVAAVVIAVTGLH